MLVLRKSRLKSFFHIKIELLQSLDNKLSSSWLGRKEKNSEIVTIFNKYKNTWDDLINNSDPKSPLEKIDERSCNALKSRGGSTSLSEENYLDKNILVSNRSL